MLTLIASIHIRIVIFLGRKGGVAKLENKYKQITNHDAKNTNAIQIKYTYKYPTPAKNTPPKRIKYHPPPRTIPAALSTNTISKSFFDTDCSTNVFDGQPTSVWTVGHCWVPIRPSILIVFENHLYQHTSSRNKWRHGSHRNRNASQLGERKTRVASLRWGSG